MTCPVSAARATMTEDEYWADLARGLGHPQDLEPDDDEPDPLGVSFTDTPCEVCGTTGACMYDPNGLPLIHATEPT